jgi:2-amino-4-hydroxy-6-hydroxymethyldihydropteridine diphosphokinase
MTLCYLGLGSNLDSPERQLRQACHALRQIPGSRICKIASFYLSKPWGRKAQPAYYNTVVSLETSLNPHQLLYFCRKIEDQQGRIRKIRWGSRTLDIDILLYGSQTVNRLKLKIPHPRLHERDFVFIPLLEIADKPIMINGKSLQELVADNQERLIVKRC